MTRRSPASSSSEAEYLSRYPTAPASMTRTTASSTSQVVRATTWGWRGARQIWRVASIPSMTGMPRSMSTMSASTRPTASIA